MAPIRPPGDWRRSLSRATQQDRHWKLSGLTVFMAVFFVIYFLLMKYPVFPVTEMPETMIDRWVRFHPAALWLYASLWFYVSLPPMLLDTRKRLIRYGWAAGAVAAFGLAIFFFWPTKIPAAIVDWSRYSRFAFLRQIDASGNACPSLHAAFAVFSAVWLGRLLRQAGAPLWVRGASVLWGAGIVYSTLATKQHVALDVAAGVVLGLAGAAWRQAEKREE
jgi:membrane-associated phospholipid phosphatase